ncbi:pantetheine-phosphate adenylyltransferase [Pyruvatibacter sp.]|uniref:pantetheine-phosphate adenylyltransferase n=1 Tax=Pyruvatibacter sp. TaxID=1981328 RepID=UPI0032ED420B
MMKRTGLYPGTFDPITNGHMDIIGRAMKMVDHLVIGVAINRDKGPLFSLEERVAMVEEEVANLQRDGTTSTTVKVQPFESLLMHFAEEIGAQMIIRGLRAVSDFEYEFQMAGMNERLNPDIETVFLMAEAQHQAVASRLVKEIARLGGDISHFTTPMVRTKLLARFEELKQAAS